MIEENRFHFLPSSLFFEWLEYLGQYLSGTLVFVKRGHISNRTQTMVLNCWQSPWQNCGQSKLMCFPNPSWSLLKGEEGLRRVQNKADWMKLSCFGKEGVSIVAWTQATQCYLPCFPVMKIQVGAYTGQEISCKVARIHNSGYVIFLSLWPLVYLAQIQHSE